jgi:MATE family multidrug resistance protein
MAVSTAISIKVAYYYGANLPVEIKRYSYTALLFTLVFMSICSVILYLFPSQIIGLFTNDADVIKISIPLICVVAAYQIFDGMQGITSGILKGFKMTKTVTACVIAGYWFIGAPIAYITVYKYNMSLKGFWIALAISLCFMGAIQLLIAKYRYKSLLKNN